MRDWVGLKDIQKGKEAGRITASFSTELKWNSIKNPASNVIWAERGNLEKSCPMIEASELLIHLYYDWLVEMCE